MWCVGGAAIINNERRWTLLLSSIFLCIFSCLSSVFSPHLFSSLFFCLFSSHWSSLSFSSFSVSILLSLFSLLLLSLLWSSSSCLYSFSGCDEWVGCVMMTSAGWSPPHRRKNANFTGSVVKGYAKYWFRGKRMDATLEKEAHANKKGALMR